MAQDCILTGTEADDTVVSSASDWDYFKISGTAVLTQFLSVLIVLIMPKFRLDSSFHHAIFYHFEPMFSRLDLESCRCLFEKYPAAGYFSITHPQDFSD